MKNFASKIIIFLFTTSFLFGCSGPHVSQYVNEKPLLELSEYFSGTIDAYGIFTDRNGNVVKRFTVLIQSSWEVFEGKKVGTLDESFEYSDGTKQKRIWHITEISPGKYIGKADDVVGHAIGLSSGNALNWSYTLALPVDGTIYNVQFDDWMYLVTSKMMINKAKMTKFGINLGEVTLSFHKR